MSDLVEKVARAAYDAEWEGGFDSLKPNGIERALAGQIARAAIKAVAEWLEETTPGVTDGELYLVARIRKQLEDKRS